MTKYQHRFANVGLGSLEFSAREIGILCLLSLRGAQNPGELRSRSNRLCQFDSVSETEAVLQSLAKRGDGPFVVRLEREPGRREVRFAHLFGDPNTEFTVAAATEVPSNPAERDGQRIAQPEGLVLELQESLEEVKARLALLEGGAED